MRSLNRRTMLKSAGAGLAVATVPLPRIAFAAPAIDARFIVIVQRGGMDGLAAVPAHGDLHYEAARAGIALRPPGEPDGVLPLDSTFALHPTLTEFATLWRDGALLPIHATC